MARVTDHPDMTLDVYRGQQHNTTTLTLTYDVVNIFKYSSGWSFSGVLFCSVYGRICCSKTGFGFQTVY